MMSVKGPLLPCRAGRPGVPLRGPSPSSVDLEPPLYRVSEVVPKVPFFFTCSVSPAQARAHPNLSKSRSNLLNRPRPDIFITDQQTMDGDRGSVTLLSWISLKPVPFIPEPTLLTYFLRPLHAKPHHPNVHFQYEKRQRSSIDRGLPRQGSSNCSGDFTVS